MKNNKKQKVGRNDLCPCGSGIKFKKCCLNKNEKTKAELDLLRAKAEKEYAQKAKQRKNKFGMVRPTIHADFKGHKFVAVGSGMMHSKNWKTVPDFLMDYGSHILGGEWGNAEIKKPFDERHQIMKWYDGMCKYQQKVSSERDENGLFNALPNADWQNYLLLAYDLYVLEHHSSFQEQVLKRLKNKDQFQGARYELFVAATCIRAGYEIEYEDESDSTVKHSEFNAVHSITKRRISVEAKSKHRPGLLDFAEKNSPEIPDKAKIKTLIGRALSKPATGDRVIFVELNLPPSNGNLIQSKWFKELADAAISFEDSDGNDPFEMLAFTNHPSYFDTGDALGKGKESLVLFGKGYDLENQPPGDLFGIKVAIDQAGNIPNFFDE